MKKEIKIINTQLYFLVKIGIFVFGILSFIFLAPVLTRGTRESIMQAHGFPFYIEILVGFFGFVFLITALTFLFMKERDLGNIELSEEEMLIKPKDKKVNFSNCQKIRLLLNPNQNKSIHYREITSFGGNNWLEVENSDGEKHQHEFLIRSEKQENDILELVQKWKEDGLNVEVGKARKMFWERFM